LHEVKALLYGDLILTSAGDCCLICSVLAVALLILLIFIRPIFYSFLDREYCTVLGLKPAAWELLYFILLGLVVAAASKVAGAILVFSYLIVPAIFALMVANKLWRVLVLAVFVALVATGCGLCVSFAMDLPTNQTICVAACALLLCAAPLALIRGLFDRRQDNIR